MSTERPAGGDDRRRHPRVSIERPIRIRFSGCDDYESFTANLSAGGLFVLTEHPQGIGCVFGFQLDLDDGPLKGLGEVMWRRRGAGASQPSGMGVRFRELPSEAFRRLDRYLAHHLAEAGRAALG